MPDFTNYEAESARQDAIRERICPIDPAELSQCDSCQ